MTTTPLFDLLRTAARERFGGSITRLAEACDTSVQLASRWLAEDERKRTVPSPTSCAKIASALSVDVDYVLELAGHRPPNLERAPLDPELSAFLADIEAGWRAMDHAERRVAERGTLALFGVPPVERPSIGRRRRASMRPEGEVRERERTDRDTGENTPNAGLDGSYAGLKALLPAVFGRITTRRFSFAG